MLNLRVVKQVYDLKVLLDFMDKTNRLLNTSNSSIPHTESSYHLNIKIDMNVLFSNVYGQKEEQRTNEFQSDCVVIANNHNYHIEKNDFGR